MCWGGKRSPKGLFTTILALKQWAHADNEQDTEAVEHIFGGWGKKAGVGFVMVCGRKNQQVFVRGPADAAEG